MIIIIIIIIRLKGKEKENAKLIKMIMVDADPRSDM